VLATDVQDDAGTDVAGQITTSGGRAAYAHIDVTSQQEWEAAVTGAVREFGGLDILVNNAGMADLAGIEDTPLADWHRTTKIGQTGVFLGMKTAAAALAASGHGSVISINSVFGASGAFGISRAYQAAKGAVRTLTKNIALHWAGRGVRVNSVHPGFSTPPYSTRPKERQPGRR
jgi:NAD(P)-dependent dehydrogenase (short-subunit alcohol dehydrogenase family)